MFSFEFCELLKNTYFKKHLRRAGSKTLVRGFLFNKVANLQILCNFKESFFVEHLLATFSFMMFLLLLFFQTNEVCNLKSICLVK